MQLITHQQCMAGSSMIIGFTSHQVLGIYQCGGLTVSPSATPVPSAAVRIPITYEVEFMKMSSRMDKQMYEASWTGNVDLLLKLVGENPSRLHSFILYGGETPLHVACMAGHQNFVREVLKLKKEFASEINQDGFSPLHIASANGNVEIVKEILRVDHNLCLLKGIERRIPLHYAAMRGGVHVMRELLSVNIDAIADVTARGETALHLAVKNHHIDAFEVLVHHLKQLNKEEVLNRKDHHGNTILHLAVLKRQYEVVDLLLNENTAARGMLDVNSLNERGLTLDVLLVFPSEAGDREIEEILRKSGAQSAEDLYPLASFNSQAVESNGRSNELSSREPETRSPAKRLQDYFKYDKVKDSPTAVRNYLLVIAVLITTATYQAVLSPPGGVWQDNSGPNNNNTNGNTTSTLPQIAGKSIMGTTNMIGYCLFLFTNSVGIGYCLFLSP